MGECDFKKTPTGTREVSHHLYIIFLSNSSFLTSNLQIVHHSTNQTCCARYIYSIDSLLFYKDI